MKPGGYWNVETAHLSYSREGCFLVIQERPLWAVLTEKAGEWFASEVAYHLLCCHIPEFTFKIRWAGLGDDGYTDKCLGSKLYRLGEWLNSGCGAWRQYREIARVPVTGEWVTEHYPDAGWPFDDSGDDEEMRHKPGDEGDVVL